MVGVMFAPSAYADGARSMRVSPEGMAWAERMASEVEACPSKYIGGERERAFRARMLALEGE